MKEPAGTLIIMPPAELKRTLEQLAEPKPPTDAAETTPLKGLESLNR